MTPAAPGRLQRWRQTLAGLDRADPWSWPVLPRRVLGLAVCLLAGLLVLLGGWLFRIHEIEAQQADEQSRHARLRADYRGKVAKARELGELRREGRAALGSLGLLEGRLPASSDMEALLAEINRAGQARGLEFLLFKPGLASRQGACTEQPVALRVAGSYPALGAFVADVAGVARIVTLNDLGLSRQAGGQLLLDGMLRALHCPFERDGTEAGPAGDLARRRHAQLFAEPAVTLPAASSALADRPGPELQAWMADIARRPLADARPDAAAMPPGEAEPEPPVHAAFETRDPFDPARPGADAAGGPAEAGEPGPSARIKDVLEAFPLTAMTMVGTLQQGTRRVALIRVDRYVHAVRAGQRLGLNQGRVTQVLGDRVEFVESIADGRGGWLAQPAMLHLTARQPGP